MDLGRPGGTYTGHRGVDSRGRPQYLYHEQWREQRDAQKFDHMLRFAQALPELRAAALGDLKGRGLNRDRVTASAVRLIDVGLFRNGGERYAELDHHYGVSTLLKQHVRVTRAGIAFDYIAKEGKRRAVTVADPVLVPAVRSLARVEIGLDALFCWRDSGPGSSPAASAAWPACSGTPRAMTRRSTSTRAWSAGTRRTARCPRSRCARWPCRCRLKPS